MGSFTSYNKKEEDGGVVNHIKISFRPGCVPYELKNSKAKKH